VPARKKIEKLTDTFCPGFLLSEVSGREPGLWRRDLGR
jgi:hypothetical protein